MKRIIPILSLIGVLTLLLISGCTIKGSPISETNTTPNNLIQLKFQPKQCEPTPWEAWLANSSIRFIRAPTDKEIANMYYGNEMNITLHDFLKAEKTGGIVCMACYTCATPYHYTVEVDRKDAPKMITDGWIEFKK